MDEFILQPGIYMTGSHSDLFEVLDSIWLDPQSSEYRPGTYYIVSGFGTHNGGVRFFEKFRHHVSVGGRVRAILGGSRSMNLSSRQLGQALLACGAEVSVVNRKRIMHAKLYGSKEYDDGRQHLVTTSGNFTWPGLAGNIEAVLSLGPEQVSALGFSWDEMFQKVIDAPIDLYDLSLAALDDPAWSLLYDELAGRGVRPSEDGEVEIYESMVLTLSHADTVRISAPPGTAASRGTQYFWLSKDVYDFFPALTIRNSHGRKATYSAMIDINFMDLGATHPCRVTFEAENNLDFRLGTGPLKGTHLASQGDMAVLTRRGETDYELRLVRQGTRKYRALLRYALNFIGHQGKRYGFVPNSEIDRIFGI